MNRSRPPPRADRGGEVDEPSHHPDDAFRSAIANGVPQHHWPFGDVPPVAGLTDDDIDAVIAFICAEQQRQGFEQ